MTRRVSFWLLCALLASAVVFRAFPFVWWPDLHFDSDQGIVGLMAKHISEGRAFPLYYYGQPYMLAVEAYAVEFEDGHAVAQWRPASAARG